jgi:hypothetical protein
MEAPRRQRTTVAPVAPQVAKTRRKRTLTEARKTQNRIAQQAYRKSRLQCTVNSAKEEAKIWTGQRQRDRIRELESSRAGQPSKERPLLPQAPIDTPAVQVSTFDESGGAGGDVTDQFCSFNFDVGEGVGIDDHAGGVGVLDYDIDISRDISMSSIPVGIGIGETSTSTSTSAAPFTALYDDIDAFAAPSSTTTISSNLCQDFISTLALPTPSPSLPQATALPPQSSHPLTLEAAILDDKVGLEEIVSAGLDFLLGRRPVPLHPSSRSLASPTRLPDPYANALRFVRASTFAAYLNNARALHFDIPSLFAEACPSPFYRPSSPTVDLPSLHKSVLRAFPSIPAHLRPTLPQILYPHHPYLDLLPFPVLRARAIALANAGTAVYDPLDLKRDIVREGLICWRSSNRTGSGSGQPWDGRSWEAAGWFLRKWRLLVGGEEGELWRQSVWWRRMRDEGEE